MKNKKMESTKKKEETISISKPYYNELICKKSTKRDVGKLIEITKKELEELIKIKKAASAYLSTQHFIHGENLDNY